MLSSVFLLEEKRIDSSPTPHRQLAFPPALPVLSPQSQEPSPLFRNVNHWVTCSETLEQNDLGFPSHPHLSAGVWADTRTDSCHQWPCSSGARGCWCMAAAFPRQRRDASSTSSVGTASPQRSGRKGVLRLLKQEVGNLAGGDSELELMWIQLWRRTSPQPQCPCLLNGIIIAPAL